MDNQISNPSINATQNQEEDFSNQNKSNKSIFLIIFCAVFIFILLFIGIYILKINGARNLSQNLAKTARQQSFPKTPTQINAGFNTKTESLETIPKECNDSILPQDFVFSSDGKRVAFNCTTSNGMFVIADNQRGKIYAKVKDLTFSPDGKHLGYIATMTTKQSPSYTKSFAVVDNIEQKSYDYVGNVVFSPDSSTFAYAAGLGVYMVGGDARVNTEEVYFSVKTAFVVVGNKEGTRYDGSGIDIDNNQVMAIVNDVPYFPVFSPDGKTVAYQAIKNNTRFIVKDSQEITKYPYEKNPYFTANGQLVFTAYSSQNDANHGTNFITVVGTTEYKNGYPIFDGKGNPIGLNKCIDCNSVDTNLQLTLGQTQWNTVSSSPSSRTEEFFPLTVSPSDPRVAYVVQENWVSGNSFNEYIVVDNRKLTHYAFTANILSRPVFSPDGHILIYLQEIKTYSDEKVALLAYNGSEETVLDSSTDNKETNVLLPEQWSEESNVFPWDLESLVSPPVFSSDGKYAGYGDKIGNQLWWHAINLSSIQ